MGLGESIGLGVCAFVIMGALCLLVLDVRRKPLHYRPHQPSKMKAWWAKKTPKEKKQVRFLLLLIPAVLVLWGVVWGLIFSDLSSADDTRTLSEATKKKLYYDMVATQDQNPYSNEWNEGVKQAAAKAYNVPMSEINDIIHEGATEGWLTPTPP